MSSDFPMKRKL